MSENYINFNEGLKKDVQNAIFDFEQNIQTLENKVIALTLDIDKLLEIKKDLSESDGWNDFCEKTLNDCLKESSILNVELLLAKEDLIAYQKRVDDINGF